MSAELGPVVAAANGGTETLAGSVDQPRDGETVTRGRMIVAGWHAWAHRPAVAVAVALGGETVSVATPGAVRRPDVAAAYGAPGMEATGWSTTLDLTGWKHRSARLDLVVWPARESSPVSLAPITVWLADDAVPPPAGALDEPAEGALLKRGVVMFAGWAFDPIAPVDRVEIVIGDRQAVPARLGQVREDVLELSGFAHARLSGFEAIVDLADFVEGPDHIRVEVVAHTLGGEPFLIAEQTHRLGPAGTGSPDPQGAKRQTCLHERTRNTLDRLAPPATPGDLDLLVFAHDLGFGGAQLWLLEFLRRSGAGRLFGCTVIAPRPGPLLGTLEGLGIAVHVTNGYPVEDVETYEGCVAELAALSCRGGHTAVLVNSFCSFIGTDVAGRLGIPCAWAIHESYQPALLWSALYRPDAVDPLVRVSAVRALRNASALVFVAEATRRLFLSATEADRALTIPYGVDTAAIDRVRGDGVGPSGAKARARASLGLPADATVVLLVGAPEARKALTTTAEAFARVAEEFPDAMLIFLGAGTGTYTDALRSYVADVGLGERCLVLQAVEDTSVWYLAADLLVCASDVESLPRVLLEAMCFGVPVLATAVFGVPDLITDGETGWLFEPRSVAAAENALRRVLGLGAETRRAVAAAGSAEVHDRYDSDRYVADVSLLLRGIAADPAARPRDLLVDRLVDRGQNQGSTSSYHGRP